jgi:hypothetical protein
MTIFQRISQFNAFALHYIKPKIFKKNILCAQLCAPYGDPHGHNVFDLFTKEEIVKLRTDPNTYFLFDYTLEGTSYQEFFNFYLMLTTQGQALDIPPNKIVFTSSNLFEESSYDHWQKQHSPGYRINVFSFCYWDYYINSTNKNLSIEQTIANIKDKQHFLNFNRRLRPFRLSSIYKIFTSTMFKNTLISFDKLNKDQLVDSLNSLGVKFDLTLVEQLVSTSPSMLDTDHFDAGLEYTFPDSIINSALINLVSETLCDSYGNTSLFYTEKTFKPMVYNCPVYIMGQQNQNTLLEKCYYKNYNTYFDFSADVVADNGQRVQQQIEYLETVNERLSAMTVGQKIEWYLQGKDTLLYNKEVLREQRYNKEQAQKLLACFGPW